MGFDNEKRPGVTAPADTPRCFDFHKCLFEKRSPSATEVKIG